MRRAFKTFGRFLGYFTVFVITPLIIACPLVAIVHPASTAPQMGQRKVKADFAAIKQALRMYKIDTGRYPRTIDELLERDPRTGKGPWIEEMCKDPWGHPYLYTYQAGGKYNLISFGADGRPGGKDEDRDLDLTNINDPNQAMARHCARCP